MIWCGAAWAAGGPVFPRRPLQPSRFCGHLRHGHSAGKLIREIVGLDRAAAQEAFGEFLSRGNLTADQMTFLNQVIDPLVHNGTMDPNVLFGSPFTDFHDNGVVGVLPQDAQAIVRTIQAINRNALVA